MSDILTKSKEETVFTGLLIEIARQTLTNKNGKEKVFELATRPPGVRLIVVNKEKQQILLTKEYRYDLEEIDYRLPGGKVCDSIAEYNAIPDKKAEAVKAAIWESRQEAGIIISNPKLFTVAKSGSPSFVWDLYYFVVDEYTEASQELEFGESITVEWTDISKVIEIALSDKMKEDRTVGVLMKYLRSIGRI